MTIDEHPQYLALKAERDALALNFLDAVEGLAFYADRKIYGLHTDLSRSAKLRLARIFPDAFNEGADQ